MNLTVTLRIEPLPGPSNPSTTAMPTPPDLAITLPPISTWLPIVIQILQWIQSIGAALEALGVWLIFRPGVWLIFRPWLVKLPADANAEKCA